MLVGSELSDVELADLAKRWINRDWAVAARIRSVTHLEGKQLVGGRNGADYSGMSIPYFLPGFQYEITYRLRRANPEIDARTRKPKGKYLSAPQDRNHLYYPPGTQPEELRDVKLPILFVEGELKAIAMRRLSVHENNGKPRFLVVGLSGVNNWRGTVEIETNENGVRVPVKGPIHELLQLVLPNRPVIIAFDADAIRKPEVRKARHAFSLELRSRGANVGNLVWDLELGKGPDDWVANVGPWEVLAAIGKVDFNTASGWKAKLLCTDTGKPKALVENARIALEEVPEFSGLALDEFSGKITRPGGVPWPASTKEWTDLDSIEFAAWLQRNRIDMGKETAFDAVQIVAARNRFNPVREYLEALEWDGIPRVDRWLVDYLGVKPSNYAFAAGRCWLISAVARAMQPGCKVDVALLLIGPQGRGKSTACRILGGDWFSDNLPDLGHKDAQVHIRACWIVELQELAALNKAELTTVRAWMSRNEDIYRPPYGRQDVHQKRQCVFIATSNEGEPLKDTTGNRRFWPVEVGDINLNALARDRDQMWAEAVELYRGGNPWHFTDQSIIEAATAAQAERVDLPVWFDVIQKWCTDRELVTAAEILRNAVGKDQDKQTQADKMNVVRCLQAMGWRLTWRRLSGKATKVYLNPEYLPSEASE